MFDEGVKHVAIFFVSVVVENGGASSGVSVSIGLTKPCCRSRLEHVDVCRCPCWSQWFELLNIKQEGCGLVDKAISLLS